jgi:hypothetical protein
MGYQRGTVTDLAVDLHCVAVSGSHAAPLLASCQPPPSVEHGLHPGRKLTQRPNPLVPVDDLLF